MLCFIISYKLKCKRSQLKFQMCVYVFISVMYKLTLMKTFFSKHVPLTEKLQVQYNKLYFTWTVWVNCWPDASSLPYVLVCHFLEIRTFLNMTTVSPSKSDNEHWYRTTISSSDSIIIPVISLKIKFRITPCI